MKEKMRYNKQIQTEKRRKLADQTQKETETEKKKKQRKKIERDEVIDEENKGDSSWGKKGRK